MQHKFMIFDDFYEDPESVAELALARPYTRTPGVFWPGQMAPTPQDITPLMKRIAEALNMPIKWQFGQGGFRITTREDFARRPSHVHLDDTDFSAVVHLSRAPVDGTYFYRHKQLGLEYVDATDHARPEVGEALMRDSLDASAWEVVHMIPMRFNRLVVFDGRHFHSGARQFSGDSLVAGRLTQHFFFNAA